MKTFISLVNLVDTEDFVSEITLYWSEGFTLKLQTWFVKGFPKTRLVIYWSDGRETHCQSIHQAAAFINGER